MGLFAVTGTGDPAVIEWTMNSYEYQSIVDSNVWPCLRQLKLGPHWVMHLDNDRKYSNKFTTEWLKKEKNQGFAISKSKSRPQTVSTELGINKYPQT